jgi:hypothetical protein
MVLLIGFRYLCKRNLVYVASKRLLFSNQCHQTFSTRLRNSAPRLVNTVYFYMPTNSHNGNSSLCASASGAVDPKARYACRPVVRSQRIRCGCRATVTEAYG